jgi:hypothetical protein
MEKTKLLNLVGDKIPFVVKIANRANVNSGLMVGLVLFLVSLVAMIL